MWLIKSLIYGGLFWASASFAVSRVGGGTCSNPEEGFTYSLPSTFQASPVFSDDSIQLFGGWTVNPTNDRGFIQENVKQFLLRNQFSALVAETDRAKFGQYFANANWISTPALGRDTCLEVFVYESPTGYNVVLGWGAGRGVFFVAPNSEHAKWGIAQATRSLHLDPGACAWK